MRPLVQTTFAAPGLPAADEPLLVHRRAGREGNDSLVVFVHGLGGSRYGEGATWGDFPRLLFEDLPQVDVGLYGYRTLFGRLKFWRSVDLEVEAEVFAHQIRDHLLPYRTIVLAGHSMGGLLAMGAIAWLAERAPEALARIGGLILMATPQFGSQRTPRGLGWLSRDFQALKPHGRFVTGLQETFAHRLVLSGNRAEPGRHAVPTWVLAGSTDLWVDRLSAVATLPPARVSLVRGSHTSIVKPRDREADAYRSVRGWIENRLERKAAAALAAVTSTAKHIAISKLPATGETFVAREEELAKLHAAWASGTNVISFVAMGGAWKSQLYSLQGYRYCDLLLAQAEPEDGAGLAGVGARHREACEEVRERRAVLHLASSKRPAPRHRPRPPRPWPCLPRPGAHGARRAPRHPPGRRAPRPGRRRPAAGRR